MFTIHLSRSRREGFLLGGVVMLLVAAFVAILLFQ
jgi:hypothetical protein